MSVREDQCRSCRRRKKWLWWWWGRDIRIGECCWSGLRRGRGRGHDRGGRVARWVDPAVVVVVVAPAVVWYRGVAMLKSDH